MVYCTKCGTKNSDDAKTCIQCGASLYGAGETEPQRVEDECGGRRRRGEPYRRMEYECFGIPGGAAIIGVAIGLIILAAGIIYFLRQVKLVSQSVDVWPFAIIVFGILLLIGALYALRRRR